MKDQGIWVGKGEKEGGAGVRSSQREELDGEDMSVTESEVGW